MAILITAIHGWFCYADAALSHQIIRIAVLNQVRDVVIATKGYYKISDPKTKTILFNARGLKNSLIRGQQEGIQIGHQIYPVRQLRIESNKTLKVFVRNHWQDYRGSIDILLSKVQDNHLSVINRLDLEEYVRGVLYHEVSHKWPMQAIMAQAVAVRTYALYQVQQNRKKSFDVTNDIYSQVYGGKTAERYRTNIAAKRTLGEVLFFGGEVLPAYYHSNSGGRTEDVAELWKQDLLPLKGVVDPYSKGAPNYKWKKSFRSKDIQDKLNEYGYNLGLIKEIRVLERNPSGRIRKIKIMTRDGKETILPGKDFREMIGPNIIKSNFYDIEMKGYYFDVLGYGWGHGVGMCQWGAYNMSRQRFNYKEILRYYYPGSEIRRL